MAGHAEEGTGSGQPLIGLTKGDHETRVALCATHCIHRPDVPFAGHISTIRRTSLAQHGRATTRERSEYETMRHGSDVRFTSLS
jgi:hypothetical protein